MKLPRNWKTTAAAIVAAVVMNGQAFGLTPAQCNAFSAVAIAALGVAARDHNNHTAPR